MRLPALPPSEQPSSTLRVPPHPSFPPRRAHPSTATTAPPLVTRRAPHRRTHLLHRVADRRGRLSRGRPTAFGPACRRARRARLVAGDLLQHHGRGDERVWLVHGSPRPSCVFLKAVLFNARWAAPPPVRCSAAAHDALCRCDALYRCTAVPLSLTGPPGGGSGEGGGHVAQGTSRALSCRCPASCACAQPLCVFDLAVGGEEQHGIWVLPRGATRRLCGGTAGLPAPEKECACSACWRLRRTWRRF